LNRTERFPRQRRTVTSQKTFNSVQNVQSSTANPGGLNVLNKTERFVRQRRTLTARKRSILFKTFSRGQAKSDGLNVLNKTERFLQLRGRQRTKNVQFKTPSSGAGSRWTERFEQN
jgi:hypothetical protein